MRKALGFALLSVLAGCNDPTGGGKLTITKHENGKTASRGYMLTDHIKVGDWVYFFENGQMCQRGRYVDHQRHGTWTFWLAEGGPPWTATYTYGRGPENGWAEKPSTETTLRSTGCRREGLREGVWTVWRENGRKWASGPFKNDKQEGVWTNWRENGMKLSETTFKDGEREGAHIGWHENGQKMNQGTWKGNKLEGVWTSWDENGQKTDAVTFKNHKKEGVKTYWDNKGNVTKTETYKNGELVE